MIWALLRKSWPLFVGGLLLFGAWQLVQSHRAVSADNGRLEQRVETLKEDLEAEAAVADVIADQAKDARDATKKLHRELNQLRDEHERLRKSLREVVKAAPPGDCLHQPVHPGADRLLGERPTAANEDPVLPDSRKPGAP